MDEPCRHEKAGGGGGFFPNFPESGLTVDDMNNFKRANSEEKEYLLISDKKYETEQ